MTRFACCLMIPLLLAACGGEVEDTRPGQPVKQRQQAFKEMLKVFEPMGTMMRTNRYDAGKFEALAKDLMVRREAPWSHFGPDTFYPPTKAKAEVWQDAARFEQHRQDFLNATDKLLAAATSQDKTRAEAAYKAVYDSCQACHTQFRTK
jgi:cytochrome c556